MSDASTHGVGTAKDVLMLVAALLVMVASVVGCWNSFRRVSVMAKTMRHRIRVTA